MLRAPRGIDAILSEQDALQEILALNRQLAQPHDLSLNGARVTFTESKDRISIELCETYAGDYTVVNTLCGETDSLDEKHCI